MSDTTRLRSIFARTARLPEGWRDRVTFGLADGIITSVTPDSDPDGCELTLDVAIPPMPSLHSHAFQRAMAGLAETRTDPTDSFWTWRTRMYRLALGIAPDDMQAVATGLYMQMLKAGYAHVGEFHYLHRTPEGDLYDEPAELSLRLARAAREAGIGLTLLPTLYARADFGRDLASEQRRFASGPELIARIIQTVRAHFSHVPEIDCGIGLHSLRAVPPEQIRDMLRQAPGDAPVHIHAAEQTREVEGCIAHLGRRPVAWLLDECSVDERWCVVHATHLDADETDRLARSRAVAGLCPITEANLGDGLFPLQAFLDAGGRYGIGSDSNILISPGEELRMLEYGQRLATRTRARALPSQATGSIGGALYDHAVAGGRQACGLRGPAFGIGARADFCGLDRDRLSLPGLAGDTLLDSAIFACPALPVSDVVCAARHVVHRGEHRHEAQIARAFRAAIRHLDDL